MPINDKRIVVVTPAGRRRYLALLIPQVLKYASLGLVDEYQLWQNTTDALDIEYMEQMAADNPVIRIRKLPDGVKVDGNLSIHCFFPECCATDTVYVRFDDDIVALDSPEAFVRFVEFRIASDNFLVYANILNNAIVAHILQRLGKLDLKEGFAAYSCMDKVGWNTPAFTANLHDQVLSAMQSDKGLSVFHFDGEWILWDRERVSINCISWKGEVFADNKNKVGHDEELELACSLPHRMAKLNTIYGGYCVAHYSFYTTRSELDRLGYQEKYEALIECARRRTTG